MSVADCDKQLFHAACEKVMRQQCPQKGIGTLSEKTVHAVLKNFYETDPAHQEIPVENYVADILRDGEIIEIQTRSLNAMRRKLDCFLSHYPVTIVHPIIHTKWICWINEQTGEVTKRRKSPKTGSRYDAFYELYKIKMFLNHPNLHLCLPLIDAEEYRLLNGWSTDRKRGSTRYDRIPTALVDEIYIGSTGDYQCMIPDTLPTEFTAKDYAKESHLAIRYARTAVNVLRHVGAISFVRKQGQEYVYRVQTNK